MMAEMTIDEFNRRLQFAIKTGALQKGMVAAANKLAVKMDDSAKKRVTGGGTATDRLNVRTGNLRDSIKWKVKTIPNGVRATIQAGGSAGGALVKYARIHETGEPLITMRRGKKLKKPIKIPKRPYLKPARDEAAKIAPDVVQEEVIKALRTVIGGA